MKRIIVSILWLVSATSLFAQNFSGEITKKTTIIARQEGLDTDSILNEKFGDTSVYLITDGYYKSSYLKNGEMTYGYTYHKGEDKIFDENAEDPYITYRDVRKPNSTESNRQVFRDSTIEVMGYKCFLVKSEYEDHTTHSYYTDELKVKYDNFEGHTIANWYEHLKELDGAQLLKVVSEYASYTEVSEAIKVDVRDVAISEFDLPNDKPVVASYQALDEEVGMKEVTTAMATCYNEKISAVSSSKPDATENTVYISLIVTEDGSMEYLKAVEEDANGFHKVALDIVQNCGLKLVPGKIDGKAVASQTYFPITFRIDLNYLSRFFKR
ncbi:MAG: hypothetical protein Roseis2KO_57160 [Roseivirga sp.]